MKKTPKLYRSVEVAKMMVENRRAFAPRVVENKRRKAQLSPKHKGKSLLAFG